MLDARLVSSTKYKALFDTFNCEVIDGKLIYHKRESDSVLKDGQEIRICALFNFGHKNSAKKVLVDNYDRFNFDELAKRLYKNPACKLYLSQLKKDYKNIAKDFEKATDADLEDAPDVDREKYIKYFKSKPFKVTKNSTKEDKIDFVFHFSSFDVFKSIELDGKPCLECGTDPEFLIFNEQILNICDFDDFEIDEYCCEWDIDEHDILVLNFRYKGV